MSVKEQVYTGTIMAKHPSRGVQANAISFSAESTEDNAIQQYVISLCKLHYPPEEGWQDHRGSADVLSSALQEVVIANQRDASGSVATNYPRRSRPGKSLKKGGDQAPRWMITVMILGEIALLMVLLAALTFGPWYLIDRLYHLSLSQGILSN